MTTQRLKRGDTVRVVRRRNDDENQHGTWAGAKLPTTGTVVYISVRFVVLAMHTDGGRYLYCESFWMWEVRVWEEGNTSGRN